MTNQALCRELGYTCQDLSGMGFAALHPPEVIANISGGIERQSRGEEDIGDDIPTLRKDGTIVYFDINATPFEFRDRKCLLAVFRNNSQKKAAEEKFRKVFEVSQDVILIFEEESGKFIDVNKAAEKLYGYFREEFLSLNIKDIRGETPGPLDLQDEMLVQGRMHISMCYHRKKNGENFPVEIFAGDFSLDGKTVLCEYIRDISERLTLEKEVRSKMKSLQVFHNVATGRELKMIELKKRIKELEKKLADNTDS